MTALPALKKSRSNAHHLLPPAGRPTRTRRCFLWVLLTVSLFVVAQLSWSVGFLRSISAYYSSAARPSSTMFYSSSSEPPSHSWFSSLNVLFSSATGTGTSSSTADNDNNAVNMADDSFCKFGPSGLQALMQSKLIKRNESHLSPHATIPLNLIFIGNETFFTTGKPRVLYENLQSTVKSYKKVLARRNVTATTSVNVLKLHDASCRRLVYQAHPDLVLHYDAAERKRSQGQRYQRDMCRMAALYKHGGYYFDIDNTETLEPFLTTLPGSTSSGIRFVGVKSSSTGINNPQHVLLRGYPLLTQGFMASAPGHPILRETMEEMIKVLVKQQEQEDSREKDNDDTKKKRSRTKDTVGLPPLALITASRAMSHVSARCGSRDIQLLQESPVESKYDFFNLLPSSSSSLSSSGESTLAKTAGSCPFAYHDRLRNAFFRVLKPPSGTDGMC